MKKKILIFTSYYLPSVKGGGPIQSIRNLVDNLGDIFDFYILTGDRDLGDDKPFKEVVVDEWTNVDKALVYYTDLNLLNWRKIKTIIETINCDVLYLNSFFAYKSSIIPVLQHKLKKNSNFRIVLAPRGQFSNGALGLKSFKKTIFVKVAKILRLYKNVEWHATNEIEKNDIRRNFSKKTKIFTANNLTPNYKYVEYDKKITKNIGELKLVYIARIHPMKNLLQVLEILQKIKGNIIFNIYGPIEDEIYWNKCLNTINSFGANIEINYRGQIENEKVKYVYRDNHVAILLTLGENFGHSIAEALIGGCPVIISDRTPWKNLKSHNAGFDIPLDGEKDLMDAINYYINMNSQSYESISYCAFRYAKEKSNTEINIESYINMFDIDK